VSGRQYIFSIDGLSDNQEKDLSLEVFKSLIENFYFKIITSEWMKSVISKWQFRIWGGPEVNDSHPVLFSVRALIPQRGAKAPSAHLPSSPDFTLISVQKAREN
jgi:hypothetical protein